MSQDKSEVVRRALDAMGRGDVQALVDQVDENFELNPMVSVWPRTYSGTAGIEQWWRDLGELWDEFSMQAEDLRVLDEETLLALLTWRGRAKGTATEVEGPAAAVVRFRGDKVLSANFYLDEARALQAVEAGS